MFACEVDCLLTSHRYTDFLVNEIGLDGQVLHLTEIHVPKKVKADEVREQPKAKEETQSKDETQSKQETQPNEETQTDEEARPVETVVTENPEATQTAPESTSQAPSDSNGQSAEQEKPAAKKASGSAPAVIEFKLSPEDEECLKSYFSAQVIQELVVLNNRILANPNARPSAHGEVKADPITDRAIRTSMHKVSPRTPSELPTRLARILMHYPFQDVRRIFNSNFETEAQNDGSISIVAAFKRNSNRKGQGNGGGGGGGRNNQKYPNKLSWEELGGEYLHFNLYKENKDTMEVVNFIASRTKLNIRTFGFAGTKDKRACTVQRVSVFRTHAQRLVALNATLFGSKLGDFKHERHGLELGDLKGNEFHITLRDCTFPGSDGLDTADTVKLGNQVVGTAIRNLQERGFLNYYGMQRFGTFGVGTHAVGLQILQGDYEGAVNSILLYNPAVLNYAMNPDATEVDATKISQEDMLRAEAIYMFRNGKSSQQVLEKLPRKFSAETAIVRWMTNKNRKEDYIGALVAIPRNLRLMYVHAYQSLVWNLAVSERWSRYGNRVVEGDLVLCQKPGTASGESAKEKKEEVDQNGEVVVMPAAGDAATVADDVYQRARPLTAEEAESGKYSIFDVVLPTPGYDIEYPRNEIGEFYKTFMGSEAGGRLDPHDMRRKQKDFSLSGSYRKMLETVGQDVSFEVKAYAGEMEQLVPTDLDKLNGGMRGQKETKEAEANDVKKEKVAVVVKFQLRSSTYATMALRELMKGAVKAFKPEYSGGR